MTIEERPPTTDRPKVAVLTVSDGVMAGTRADETGRILAIELDRAGFEIALREAVSDDRLEIEATLKGIGAQGIPLVLTTGGTGLGRRDVTPEATLAVIDREVPGLAEATRAAGLQASPLAALSRAVAGVMDDTLVVNLPGSQTGALEALRAILPILSHAVEGLAGRGSAAAERAQRSGETPPG